MPGPPVVFTIRLTPADIASVQGLAARYYATPDWSGDPALEPERSRPGFRLGPQAPLPLPFSVSGRACCALPTFGDA